MLVTDRRRVGARRLLEVIERSCAGGLRLVQLREPDLEDDGLLELAFDLRRRVPRVRLILNDRPDLAATHGFGVQLPERRPAIAASHAVRELGFGRSVHEEAAALAAENEGADWLVLGTIFPTPSKPGLGGGGLDLVRRICRRVAPRPVFAIGGVTVAAAPQLRRAGAYGVAVSRAILDAGAVASATRALLDALRDPAPPALSR